MRAGGGRATPARLGGPHLGRDGGRGWEGRMLRGPRPGRQAAARLAEGRGGRDRAKGGAAVLPGVGALPVRYRIGRRARPTCGPAGSANTRATQNPAAPPGRGRLRVPRQGLNPGSPGWLLTAHFTDGDRGLEVCGRGGSCVRSPDPARASPAQRGRAGAQALPGGALMGPWLCVASSPLTTTRKDQPRGQGVGAHGSLPHTLPATALGSTTPPGVQLESGRARSPPGCQALPGVTWGHCSA